MGRTKVLLIAMVIALAAMAGWTVGVNAQRVVGPLPTAIQDLGTAQAVEIIDARDVVVLRGTFSTTVEDDEDDTDADDDDDNEIERTATLTPAAGGSGSGKAEVELERAGTTIKSQEIEVKVKGLQARTTFKLRVDGNDIANFTTNRSGNADLKFTSKRSPTN